MKQIFDLIGIGFGPANLSLAICIEEMYPRLKVHLFEKQASCQWHQDMMIDGADIQNHPLRDLVTPRNPRSKYTFVNFLKENGRLFDHLNLGKKFPLRIEYAQYIEWAAGHFKDKVTYNAEISAIKPCFTEEGQHTGYKVIRSNGDEHYTKCIVLAPGRTPYIPKILEQLKSERVIHFTKLLSMLSRFHNDKELKNITVVGGSQSAVEIVLELRRRYPNAYINCILRNFGYRQKDLSPFSGEVFYPEYCDFYFSADKLGKSELDQDLRFTNYSSVDSDVLDQLYLELYQDKILGIKRTAIINNVDIVDAKSIYGGVEIIAKNRYNENTHSLQTDLVISATGFRDFGSGENQERNHPLLKHLLPFFELNDSNIVQIRKCYAVKMSNTLSSSYPVFVNGLCEKSHGMGDAGSFSLLSLRAEKILSNFVNIDSPELLVAH